MKLLDSAYGAKKRSMTRAKTVMLCATKRCSSISSVTAIPRTKHRIDLESVSGLSWLAHQDLAAKILNDNLNSLLCLEALDERDGHISEGAPTVLRSAGRALPQINRTRAFAHIRQCLPHRLSTGMPPPR
jgi:hypothetical protein